MAIFARHGDEGIEVQGRARLDAREALRTRVKAMYLMRRQGYTYKEIGLIFGCSRVWVSKLLRQMPDHVHERMRDVGLT